MNKSIKIFRYIILAAVISVVFILALGIPTALVPNPWFGRMTEITALDYVFLYLEGILLGSYVALIFWQQNKKAGERCAVGGGTLGFFAFSCPICNKILVLVFGTGFLMSYLQPIRPYLGLIGVALMSFALYQKIKFLKLSNE